MPAEEKQHTPDDNKDSVTQNDQSAGAKSEEAKDSTPEVKAPEMNPWKIGVSIGSMLLYKVFAGQFEGEEESLALILRIFYYGSMGIYALIALWWLVKGHRTQAIGFYKGLAPKLCIATFLHFKWSFNNTLFIGPFISLFDIYEGMKKSKLEEKKKED